MENHIRRSNASGRCCNGRRHLRRRSCAGNRSCCCRCTCSVAAAPDAAAPCSTDPASGLSTDPDRTLQADHNLGVDLHIHAAAARNSYEVGAAAEAFPTAAFLAVVAANLRSSCLHPDERN